jgi:hypothetical protein
MKVWLLRAEINAAALHERGLIGVFASRHLAARKKRELDQHYTSIGGAVMRMWRIHNQANKRQKYEIPFYRGKRVLTSKAQDTYFIEKSLKGQIKTKEKTK